MKSKIFACFALVLSGWLSGCSTAHNQLSGLPICDHQAQYDFTFYLPGDWKGYSVLMDQWDGRAYAAAKDADVVLARGRIMKFRNPRWNANHLYQDIPIYVFTRQQWEDIHLGKYDATGAGGVIFELWHNDKFVFGIHSRYNADDSVAGWQNAQAIINKNCAAHPEPHLHDV